MKLLENILLATDFSKTSSNLVENAISLAKVFDSKISLVHVLPNDIKNENARILLDKAAVDQLDALKKHINMKGVKTNKSIIEYGGYSKKVVQVSNSLNANLILIGSGEKTKKDKFQLGTTTETIIRMSNIPVWVVKKGKVLKIKKIFCPVDFSDESKRALINAAKLARRFEAKLIILSVYNKINKQSVKYDWDEVNRMCKYDHKVDLNTFLKDFNFTGLKYLKKIKGGDPAKTILKAIYKYKPDLLIMGTTGKTGLSRFIMGSVTEKVIREVPCSFITLKTKDVISLKLEERIYDIEKHYAIANQLIIDGYFKEAINEFEYCLSINEMHIPSLKGLVKIYEKLDDIEKAAKYSELLKKIIRTIK